MKKFILPLLFVLFFTLSSCGGTKWAVSTYTPYPPSVQWVDSYNFNNIHYLYTNYPSFVWTNYYQHPFFIQYRTECLQRGIYVQPYRYNRTYRTRPITTQPRTNYRTNSGRSNKTINNTRITQNRYSSSNTTRNYNRARSVTPTRKSYSPRVQRSTPNRSSYSPSRNTQVRSNTRSTGSTRTPSVSRRSGGRINH